VLHFVLLYWLLAVVLAGLFVLWLSDAEQTPVLSLLTVCFMVGAENSNSIRSSA
jgi:hypothetical protein